MLCILMTSTPNVTCEQRENSDIYSSCKLNKQKMQVFTYEKWLLKRYFGSEATDLNSKNIFFKCVWYIFIKISSLNN